MTNEDEPKRRFIPSKWEAQRVNYLVQAIKKGWIKTGTHAAEAGVSSALQLDLFLGRLRTPPHHTLSKRCVRVCW